MKSVLRIFFVLVLFSGGNLFAEPICYNVYLEDKAIFCIKSGIGSISPETRVAAIEEKLHKLASTYTFDVDSISVVENEGEYSIVDGELNLVTLRAQDIDSKLGLKEHAGFVASAIKNAIVAYRIQHSPRSILLGILYSFLATAALIFAAILLRKAHKLLLQKSSALSEKYVAKLKIKSYQIVSPFRVHQVLTGLLMAARLMIILILLYIYVPLVLSFFPWTASWSPKIYNAVMAPVKHIFIVFFNYVPNLFYIAVILFFTHYAMKFVRLFFNEIELGNLSFNGFHKEWAQPTFKLLKIIAYAISFIMIFPYLPGSSSPAFQGLSVFLGVLISFGSGSAIANMISGIVMTYMRPFRIGDRVRIADTVGDVIEKDFLVTRIKTIKNVEVTIPNAMVLGSHIINYSTSALQDGLILHTTVTIGYDVPWNKVHELLKNAAINTNLIDQEKQPFILQTSLDDFYVSYELNAYTKHANKMAVIYSDLHQNIQDSFNASGVEIMSPHYGALRDGNEIAIPTSYRGQNYTSPAFKFLNNERGNLE